jgi:hypothetical protein
MDFLCHTSLRDIGKGQITPTCISLFFNANAWSLKNNALTVLNSLL